MTDLPPLHLLPVEDQPLTIDIKLADGMFVKQVVVERAGTVIPQHSHEYEHVSMLALGTVRCWRDGEFAGEYTAPAGIVIPARSKHAFMCMSDRVILYCIHRTDRSGEVDIHEEHQFDLTLIPGAR